MEIFIEDIPPEGLEVDATEATPWLGTIVRETAGETFRSGDRAKLHLDFHRVDGNVTLDGELTYTSHPTCDRCLAEFEEPAMVPFHMALAPLYESERQQEREEGLEVEVVKEDLEFSFYEGDRIDLDEIVREQALLSQPMKHLCRDDCQGLCQRCGKDLNAGPCGCLEKAPDPRWAALASIKLPAKPSAAPAKPKEQAKAKKQTAKVKKPAAKTKKPKPAAKKATKAKPAAKPKKKRKK